MQLRGGMAVPYIEREVDLPVLVNGEKVKAVCRLVLADANPEVPPLYAVFVRTIIPSIPWAYSHCIPVGSVS